MGRRSADRSGGRHFRIARVGEHPDGGGPWRADHVVACRLLQPRLAADWRPQCACGAEEPRAGAAHERAALRYQAIYARFRARIDGGLGATSEWAAARSYDVRLTGRFGTHWERQIADTKTRSSVCGTR